MGEVLGCLQNGNPRTAADNAAKVPTYTHKSCLSRRGSRRREQYQLEIRASQIISIWIMQQKVHPESNPMIY